MRLRVSLLALTLLAASAFGSAQSFTPVRQLKNLTPAEIDKVKTLETLNALPGGDWRFHPGDIPHGESPTLDDSTWQLIPQPKGRAGVTAPKDAVWYRRTLTIPASYNGYDISGSRIWFQFQADANDPMPEIIYLNGRRVALGEDLEPIILFEHAHPGDSVLIAVKLLHTIDDKRFRGAAFRIEPDAASTRPNPNDIVTEITTAANLLPALPTPRMDLLPTVQQALAAIDFRALTAADQKAFDASLTKAQSILSTLQPILSQVKIDLTGNAHIDAAWLWPRSETIDVVKRTFTTALQLMDEYPDYTYTQSAAQYSEWMADKYPDLNAQIKQRIKEGRWEIVGGMWVEPDLNLPGGESLVRQLLVGQRYFQKAYGVTARIGWNPDSFGYNWQLPQIYKRSGLDYFVTQKMHWNDTNQLPFRLFWWQSPDGSKVLTYFPTDYVHDNVNPTRISADFAESAQRNPGTTEHMDLYGIGDHGGGPTRDMLDQADKWIASNSGLVKGTASAVPSDASVKIGALAPEGVLPSAVPTMHYSTAQNFFTNVEKHLNPTSPTWNYDTIAKGYTPPPAGADGSVGIPTWNSELYFEYHRGVFTTQAAHKRYMRTSEAVTLDAEKLASLAWLFGNPYPANELTENWKKITFNQFHDLAAGSGIATIYRDAKNDFYEVFNEDYIISQASMKTLESRIDTSTSLTEPSAPIVVFNSLPWSRSESVEFAVEPSTKFQTIDILDSNNHRVAGTPTSFLKPVNGFTVRARVEVPALGYTVLHAVEGSSNAAMDRGKYPSDGIVDVDAERIILRDSHLQVTVSRKTGCMTSLQTLPAKTEFLAANACGNEIQSFADQPKNYDAWNVDPGTFDHYTAIAGLDAVELPGAGILVKRSFGHSHITQKISLDDGADTVRIETTIDWHEQHTLLKAAFPLAATSGKATYEIPFGSIERTTARTNSWEKAQFEVPALRWADLGDEHQGVSILNDSKYGYDAAGNTLRLTLLRSPTWPDPDADQGIQHFTYAIYPHTGPWQQAETIHRAYELNQPLTATQTFSHTGSLPATHSFVSIDQPNVILTAVKKAEDTNALIFRMYEANGGLPGKEGQPTTVTLHIPEGATAATETNLMEKPIGPALPVTNNTITLPITPYEILTVQATYPIK